MPCIVFSLGGGSFIERSPGPKLLLDARQHARKAAGNKHEARRPLLFHLTLEHAQCDTRQSTRLTNTNEE
eukprot:68594-Amphidinium_carterae.2